MFDDFDLGSAADGATDTAADSGSNFDWGNLAQSVVKGATQVALAKQQGGTRRPPPPGSAGYGYQAALGQPTGYDAYGNPLPQTAGQKLAAIAASPTTWLLVGGIFLAAFAVKKFLK